MSTRLGWGAVEREAARGLAAERARSALALVVIVTHSPEVSERCGRRARLDAGVLHETPA